MTDCFWLKVVLVFLGVIVPACILICRRAEDRFERERAEFFARREAEKQRSA